MIPGFLYGENRRLGQRSPKLYPRYDPNASEPADMVSCWLDVAAERTAAPLVYAYEDGRCFTLASVPHYRNRGDNPAEDDEPQVSIGFRHDGQEGYLRVSIPACEEPFAYTNDPDAEPIIRRIVLPPGASLSGRIMFYERSGERHEYHRIIEDYYRRLAAEHPPAELPRVQGLVWDGVHGLIDGHYHRAGNYFIYSRPYDPVVEQIANSRRSTAEWHEMLTGFVNGFPVCNALLKAHALTGAHGAREVALRVADRICRDGVSPSGLFWAGFTPGRVVTPNGQFPNPFSDGDDDAWGSGWQEDDNHLHARTISDACYHLAGMLELELSSEVPHKHLPLWRNVLRSNLTTAMRAQRSDGCFGQIYDARTGDLVREKGCGGLPWIPAMIRAHRMGLGDETFRDQLRASVLRAADGYAPYLKAENVWGAPEDNDSPTSEDGQNAVIAYTSLYEFTGDERYLDLARRAADWMLTFRKTYNQVMPPGSLMGTYGLRSTGGDYASASNNILHVFEVLSTRHLCRLSEWTGNAYYRDRARDHWAFACQYMSRVDGMYNGFRGAAAEQFCWTNFGSWNGWKPPAYHHQKGNMVPFTAIWCIAVILLAAPDAHTFFGREGASEQSEKISADSPAFVAATD
jgi:hypothetical protein